MNRNLTVHVDLYTKVCLTAIALLLTVLVLGLWAGPDGSGLGADKALAGPPGDPLVVGGGIPDTGAQRNAMIIGINETNQRLDRIVALLEGGKIRVTAVVEDNRTDGKGK
jgi:hypothetical protein